MTTTPHFEVGDLIVYPWATETFYPFKVIRARRVRTRWGLNWRYDLLDDQLGLTYHDVALGSCAKVGEDCSRKLVAS
jgi:hypothetical protein